MAKPLRIFVSSPGDVEGERRRAAIVIAELRKTYARFFDIEPILWEWEPMLASGHFQDQITPPSETHIVVVIVWSRLGTLLPPKTQTREYRGIDGRLPVTGTEWEFEDALAAQKQRGAPDLLAYRKRVSAFVPLGDKAARIAAEEQWDKLEAFWSRWFVDRGQFRAAFGEFVDLDGFEARLKSDLRKLIERRIQDFVDTNENAAAPTWLAGSPFRGLDAYRFAHAPIFFGRSAMTKAAVEQLTANHEHGRGFLLVLGASGSGKSSLAQAGVVPALGDPGVVTTVGLWRRAVLRPSGHRDGPFSGLAEALAGTDALPELLAGRRDTTELARHLRQAVDDPAFSIVTALNLIDGAARARGQLLSIEMAGLVLVVDQLEELFTTSTITAAERSVFIRCLDGLAKSGRVYVVATMRSDYWHRAAETPLLVEMAAGGGRLDLLPATQEEIIEMIRRPAEAAGIEFERDPAGDIRLDATLAAEAANEPGALPLLSFLLDELFKADIGESRATFTFASMRRLGGLRGAIANRAEATFSGLSVDVQSALPRVLRALVTVSRSATEATARPAALAQFVEGSAERQLVDALLDPQVRLLVADGDGAGARVRLAHEALLSHWDRAKRQIAQDRRDLETRDFVEQQQLRWSNTRGRQAWGLRLRDPDLANAIALDARWGDELDAETRAFIALSRRGARLLQQAVAAAAAVFAAVAIFAGWQSYSANVATQRAQKSEQAAVAARDRADQKSIEAEQRRVEAVKAQADADQRRTDAERARQQAEAAERTSDDSRVRLLLDKSEQQLALADFNGALTTLHDIIRRKQPIPPVGPHLSELKPKLFSIAIRKPNVVKLDSACSGTSSDEPVAETNCSRRPALTELAEKWTLSESRIASVVFDPTGKLLLSVGSKEIFEIDTGRLRRRLVAPSLLRDDIYGGAFESSGDDVAILGAQRSLELWNVKDPNLREAVGLPDDATGLQSSVRPNEFFVIFPRRVELWSFYPFKKSRTLYTTSRYMYSVSQTGTRYIEYDIRETNSGDINKTFIDFSLKDSGGSTLFSINAGNNSAFSPPKFQSQGTRVLTFGDDFTISVWNAADGRLICKVDAKGAEIGPDWETVEGALTDDADVLISTGGSTSIKYWDAISGKFLGTILQSSNQGHSTHLSIGPSRETIATYSDGWSEPENYQRFILKLNPLDPALRRLVSRPAEAPRDVTSDGDNLEARTRFFDSALAAREEGSGSYSNEEVSRAIENSNLPETDKHELSRLLRLAADRQILEIVVSKSQTFILANFKVGEFSSRAEIYGKKKEGRWSHLEKCDILDFKFIGDWVAVDSQGKKLAFRADSNIKIIDVDHETCRTVTIADADRGANEVTLKFEREHGRLLTVSAQHILTNEIPVVSLIDAEDGTVLGRFSTAITDPSLISAWGQLTTLTDPLEYMRAQIRAEKISPIVRAQFTAGGRQVLVVTSDVTSDGEVSGRATWWDTSGWITNVFGEIRNADVSADGRRLITTAYGGSTILRDVESGQILADVGQEDVTLVGLNADGSYALTSGGRDVTVWNTIEKKVIASLEGAGLNDAAFSPDGYMVTAASNDGTAAVWDVKTKQKTVLAGHRDKVNSATFSSNGEFVVTASSDKTARVWNVRTGDEVMSFTGHEDGVNRAAFSLDGQRVATASNDKTVRLWDVRTGRQLAIFKGHAGAVKSVAFNENGRLIVTGSEDSTARILEADGLREIGLAAW